MNYILARLNEPSTYGGIFVLLAGALHFIVPPDLQAAITTLGVAAAGLALVLLKEEGQKKSPFEIVTEAAPQIEQVVNSALNVALASKAVNPALVNTVQKIVTSVEKTDPAPAAPVVESKSA